MAKQMMPKGPVNFGGKGSGGKAKMPGPGGGGSGANKSSKFTVPKSPMKMLKKGK